jgi:hypothetical protein
LHHAVPEKGSKLGSVDFNGKGHKGDLEKEGRKNPICGLVYRFSNEKVG